MHYYQFNIGDYTSHTARLSPIEDLAYRRLLDLYYLNERPFNGCSTDVAREIGLSEYQSEVDYVLGKYFPLTDEKWTNKRASKEIRFYQSKIKSAKRAGQASGKARRNKASERPLNDRSVSVEPTNNQQPITNNQQTIKAVAKATRKTGVLPVPIKDIVSKWNRFATLHHLPQTVKITKKIEGQIRQRWNQDMPKVENWDHFFDFIGDSRFLTGRTTPGNGRTQPFRATLDWVTKESNFAKIAAEEYH